jgi:diguanylate cyclase (GGDEF)-like protein/PAS domain S-box-containing protein
MESKIAELLLKEAFGYRDHESLLVVAEPEWSALAEALAAAARDRGFQASLLVIPRRAGSGAPPPDVVLQALRGSDIALLLTPHALPDADDLAPHAGTDLRAASVPDMPADALTRLLAVPPGDIASRAAALSGALEAGRTVRLLGPAGTDVTFRVRGDREVRDGVIREKGERGVLPGGLLRVSVDPESFSGTVRPDVRAPSHDAGKPPTLTFDKGIASAADPALKRLLGAGSSVTAAGFGLNPAARSEAGGEESLLASGVAWIRVAGKSGDVDFVFSEPSVEVDGVPVPDAILAPPQPEPGAPPPAPAECAAVPSPPPELAAELHRSLFENSNDAQYAIDFATQRVMVVNDAFLRLTGYSRSRVTAGRLMVDDLVAEESAGRVAEKKSSRKQVPSERYEMKLKCADGAKKLVEVSVRRIRMEGRDVIVGALRDLTTHERMRKDLTERATDAMRKTLEIYALTEKIKNVPKLTPALLASEDETEVLAKAAKLLTQKPGLSYASARIYLIEGDHLVLRHSLPEVRSGRTRFDLTRGHRLARIARGEDTAIDFTQHDIAMALQGREGAIGVLEVILDPKEAEVMAGVAGLRAEYQNLLVSVGQILALSLENLRLFKVVKEQSETDQLTGVCNRRVFDRRLGEEVQRARRYGRDLALLMIDLDHFKHVNDGYGHQKGDETLRYISSFLKVQSRGVDVLSRYGGDEFCLLLPECSFENAISKAEALRKRFVTRKFSTVGRGSRAVRLTLSIGVAALTDAMATEFDLVRAADHALYDAKAAGRNRVRRWDPSAELTDA